MSKHGMGAGAAYLKAMAESGRKPPVFKLTDEQRRHFKGIVRCLNDMIEHPPYLPLAEDTPGWRRFIADQEEKTPGKPGAESVEGVWISFAQAQLMTGLTPDRISKLCKSGKVRSQGKRKGRKVHSGDLASFLSERSDNCP
ncbi:MAG: hypothetical protein ACLP7Q_18490 [Isosphaeraceae bacterium]